MEKDLPKTREKGEATYAEWLVKLENGTGFYDPLRKQKLKIFPSLQEGAVIKGTDKEIMLKTHNRVFGHMLLIT